MHRELCFVKRIVSFLLALVLLAGAQPVSTARAQPQPPPANGPLPRKKPMPLPAGPHPNSQYRLGPDSLP